MSRIMPGHPATRRPRGGTAVRPSSQIVRAIRKEVFDFTQKAFGAKLQLQEETISRMENRIGGYRVLPKHLEVIRQLRAPSEKAKQFQALLAELETALRAEEAEADTKAEADKREAAPPAPGGAGGAPLRAEPTPSPEQGDGSTARPPGEVAPGPEQIFEAAKAWWEQQAARFDETVRQAQTKLQEMDRQLRDWWAEEQKQFQARRDADAEAARARNERFQEELSALAHRTREATRSAQESAERAERARLVQEQRMQRWALVTTMAAVLGLAGAGVAWLENLRPRDERVTSTVTRQQEAAHPEKAEQEDGGSIPETERQPTSENALSSAADGGTAAAKVITQATRMPKGGVPGQRRAPCPQGIDEFESYCWSKWSLTSGQVEAGVCDDPQVYEPSEGWCAEHRAAYRPFYERRPRRNTEKR